LSNLKYLWLNENQLCGEIPSDLMNLTNLLSSPDGLRLQTNNLINTDTEYNPDFVTFLDEKNPEWRLQTSPAYCSSLQFSATNYYINEGNGTITITITRTGNNQGAISVNYATSDETATAGSDYTQTTGTLNWDDGDSSEKTFTVPIIDDGNSEGPETFTLSLSDPVSGENLDNATVTIQDSTCIEGKPCLVFEKQPNSVEAIKVGERLTLNLNIEVQATDSSQPVDLYVAFALPPEYVIPWIFLTERAIVTEILPFRESIVPQQKTFPILDFNVGECMGGTYTYYAGFVRENAQVDINDLASNLAVGQFILEEKCN